MTRILRHAIALSAFLALLPHASAQTYRDVNGTIVPAFVPLTCPTGGGTCTGTGGGPGAGGAITAPLGSTQTDAASVATTWGGTDPNGYVTPCVGAVGAKGDFECLLTIANSPIPPQAAWSSGTATPLIGGVSGVGAENAAIGENPLYDGGRVATAEPSVLGTNAQKKGVMLSEEGKLVNFPYTIPQLMWRGSITSTGTGAVTFTNSINATLKTYVVAVQCGRNDSGATGTAIQPITVTLNDTASSTIVIPALGGGGGNNPAYTVPLVLGATNTSLTFTSDTAITTVKCSAQGFFAP